MEQRGIFVSWSHHCRACSTRCLFEQKKLSVRWMPSGFSTYRLKVSYVNIFAVSITLQVLLIHDADTDKEAAAMDVRVGQMSDPAHLLGFAHYCEHMLFLGTGTSGGAIGMREGHRL